MLLLWFDVEERYNAIVSRSTGRTAGRDDALDFLVASFAKNLMTLFHSSPSDFLHTQDECTNESIDTYLEYKRMVEEYSDELFVPSIVEQFCKMVYEDNDHFIFFKPFCNLYFSVYADALLRYQQGKIDYKTFCMEFQEPSWMDGRRTPLNRKRLKMYIMSMREVVEAYKKCVLETLY